MRPFFDHFMRELCGHKKDLYDKKIILLNLFLHYIIIKSHKISDL